MKHEVYWIITFVKKNGISKTVKVMEEAEATNIFYRVLHGDVENLTIKKVIEIKNMKKGENEK